VLAVRRRPGDDVEVGRVGVHLAKEARLQAGGGERVKEPADDSCAAQTLVGDEERPV